jgi:hypothetical protein
MLYLNVYTDTINNNAGIVQYLRYKISKLSTLISQRLQKVIIHGGWFSKNVYININLCIPRRGSNTIFVYNDNNM